MTECVASHEPQTTNHDNKGAIMAQYASDIESVLKYKDAKKEAQNERQKILAEMKKTAAEKNNVIKKALAAQRAKFGAGAGGGNGGMSADAVLERLRAEASESFDEKLRDADEKLRKIKSPSKANLVRGILGRAGSGLF